jgi:hypothetical protein
MVARHTTAPSTATQRELVNSSSSNGKTHLGLQVQTHLPEHRHFILKTVDNLCRSHQQRRDRAHDKALVSQSRSMQGGANLHSEMLPRNVPALRCSWSCRLRFACCSKIPPHSHTRRRASAAGLTNASLHSRVTLGHVPPVAPAP